MFCCIRSCRRRRYYTLAILQNMTNNMHDGNYVGEGCLGYVEGVIASLFFFCWLSDIFFSLGWFTINTLDTFFHSLDYCRCFSGKDVSTQVIDKNQSTIITLTFIFVCFGDFQAAIFLLLSLSSLPSLFLPSSSSLYNRSCVVIWWPTSMKRWRSWRSLTAITATTTTHHWIVNRTIRKTIEVTVS